MVKTISKYMRECTGESCSVKPKIELFRFWAIDDSLKHFTRIKEYCIYCGAEAVVVPYYEEDTHNG